MSTRYLINKIFCIGLGRTGTKSLCEALSLLGYRTVHWPVDQTTCDQILSGEWRLAILDTCDVLADLPVPAIYPEVDRAFPGSRFIWTDRGLETWLNSTEAHAKRLSRAPTDSPRSIYEMITCGYVAFERGRHTTVYQMHRLCIQEYFGNRPQDLLCMRICEGDAWEKLCSWLAYYLAHESRRWGHAELYIHGNLVIVNNGEQTVPEYNTESGVFTHELQGVTYTRHDGLEGALEATRRTSILQLPE